jgi:hypothetical protein
MHLIGIKKYLDMEPAPAGSMEALSQCHRCSGNTQQTFCSSFPRNRRENLVTVTRRWLLGFGTCQMQRLCDVVRRGHGDRQLGTWGSGVSRPAARNPFLPSGVPPSRDFCGRLRRPLNTFNLPSQQNNSGSRLDPRNPFAVVSVLQAQRHRRRRSLPISSRKGEAVSAANGLGGGHAGLSHVKGSLGFPARRKHPTR